MKFDEDALIEWTWNIKEIEWKQSFKTEMNFRLRLFWLKLIFGNHFSEIKALTEKSAKLKMVSVWPKNQPKTTEIIFSRYFHFKAFPPLSHTHESLTHALPLSSLHCSDPHTEPNGTTHTDAPRSKLDAAKLRSTPIRSRSKLYALDKNRSDPLHTGNETSSDPFQALDENRSDPLRFAHNPSSDSVDAHGEFSFSVSHSDLIFLRSTLISPVHSFSISGRQPHFSDPQIITSVLTLTHCDACSLFFFLYYYI